QDLTVRVDWETGVAYPDGFPGFADEAKYEAWAGKIRAQKRQHSKVVPVPDYTGQKVCGLTVHFLPCDDVQVTGPVNKKEPLPALFADCPCLQYSRSAITLSRNVAPREP
ncbi:hypothetical protein A245_47205, partial [Pseudomonas syringae pv. actinidiae ICMP 19096]